MKVYRNVLFLLLGIVVGIIFAQHQSRSFTKTLFVDNGQRWGDWKYMDFCAPGQYAVGYEMLIEDRQGRGDDTSLNGVRLLCGSAYGVPNGAYASSSCGSWGQWKGPVLCHDGSVITRFRLQVEEHQGRRDDTAANFMQVRCRDLEASSSEYDRYMMNGYGFWGSYGSWSESCAANTAVCGIRTKVEGPQGRGDDTALNDVQLFCCN